MDQYELTERQVEALQLRAKGLGYREIGKAMGCATSNAYRLVKAALDKTLQEAADEVRAVELMRLDQMTEAWLPRALNPNPVSGRMDKDAADVVLKVADRRAKLLGLDAPQKVEIEHREGLTDKLLEDEEGVRLVAEAAAFLAQRTTQ